MDGSAGSAAPDGTASAVTAPDERPSRLPGAEVMWRWGWAAMLTPAAMRLLFGWSGTGLEHGDHLHLRMDFWIYFHAVRSPNLYSYAYVNPLDGVPNPFNYPPFAAVLMTPLRWIAERPAEYLWTSLSTIAATVALYLVVRELASSHGLSRAWVPWLVAVGLSTIPVVRTLELGQVNEFIALPVAIDVVLVSRRNRWAGIGIGVAAALKLTPLVFIPVLLFNRPLRRSGWTAVATALGVTALTAAVRWGDSVRYWTKEVVATGRVGGLDSRMSTALRRFTTWLPGSVGTAVWLVAVGALVVLVMVASRRLVAEDRVPDLMVLTGVLACVIFPITWPHHLFFAIPALLVVGCRFRTRSGLAMALVGLVVLVDPFERGAGPWFTAFQGAYLLGFVIAVCVQALRGQVAEGRRPGLREPALSS